MSPKGATHDQRVTLALKYHYLDGLSAAEIKERFEQEGVGEYARSTILNYLSDSAKEEVIEQIDKEQAHVREQIADRQERLWSRARDAEFNAYDRDEVVAMVPKFYRHKGEDPVRVRGWRVLDPEEYPPHATKFDKRIEFTDEQKLLHQNEVAPIRGPDGEPVYEPEVVAVRKIEDSKERSFLRREQADHLEKKGDALGVYEEDINLNMSGEVNSTIELDEETAAAIRQADLGIDSDE